MNGNKQKVRNSLPLEINLDNRSKNNRKKTGYAGSKPYHANLRKLQ